MPFGASLPPAKLRRGGFRSLAGREKKVRNMVRNMKIYHGSPDRNIKKFELNYRKARTDLDFGKGVYFTSKFEQAQTWSCKRTKSGAVYECDVDFTNINLLQYDSSRDEDLLYLLCFCRIGLEDIASEVAEGFDEADVIEGLVLDGTIPDFQKVAEQFVEGDLTFKELEEASKIYGDSKNQFCLKTEKALDILNSGLCKVYFTEKNEDGSVAITQIKEV